LGIEDFGFDSSSSFFGKNLEGGECGRVGGVDVHGSDKGEALFDVNGSLAGKYGSEDF